MTTGEVRAVLDSHRRRRPLRVLAYLFLAAAGLTLMIDPTQSIQAVDQDIRTYWSGLLVGGTTLTVYGAWRDRYIAEFVGLALLLTALSAFVAVLFARQTTGTIAFGCFLASLGVVMLSRWLDLWKLTGIATRAARRRR